MLAKVGREIGPTLARGQVVLASSPGRRPTALIGTLGHDQVIRAMPNTPARLGKGVTVWYATPEHDRGAARPGGGPPRAPSASRSRSTTRRWSRWRPPSRGTGPTYVFLVMEALIDAAVHLGFPRHVAHDLVVETLEGSTLFAKQSAMHPAELRNMVTSPGGTSAAALHELESGRLRTVLSEAVWAAFRRTVELGDQLEASVADDRAGARRPIRPRSVRRDRRRDRVATRPPAGAAGRRSGRSTSAPPGRDYWADEAAIHDRLVASWAGLDDAAWRLPGAAPSDAGGPDWSLLDHVGHVVDWWELGRGLHRSGSLDGGDWPTDDDYDGGDFDTFNESRRARFARSAAGGAAGARSTVAHDRRRRGRAAARPPRRSGATPRGAGSTRSSTATRSTISTILEPWADQLRDRQVRNDPFGPDPQPTRAEPRRAR